MSKEDNWLRGAGPSRMKRLKGVQQRFTQRKLRLFVCACSRSIWGVLVDERSRRAVEVAEEYADGRATREQLKAAKEAASKAEEKAARLAEKTHDDYPHSAATAAWLGTSETIKQPPYAVARREMQCDLLRDVIGNPHRPLPALEPRWLTRDVRALAKAAYEERALPAGTLDRARLALLADALEDAGCTNADLLDHLRGPGPHVRGCWALDLVLGKE